MTLILVAGCLNINIDISRNTMSEYSDFRDKTLKEIKLWAWAAAVVPISSLAGLFFIWVFGTDTLFDQAMVIGETVFFIVAVIWWWWAIYVINRIVKHWDQARQRVKEVLLEVKDINRSIKDVLNEVDK